MDYHFKWEEGCDDPLSAAEQLQEWLAARNIDSDIVTICHAKDVMIPEGHDYDLPEDVEVVLTVHPRAVDKRLPTPKELRHD